MSTCVFCYMRVPSVRVLPRMYFDPQDVYFHICTSTRCVLPLMYFHMMCSLYGKSKHGPLKNLTGMHCSIVVIPCKITHVKMK